MIKVNAFIPILTILKEHDYHGPAIKTREYFFQHEDL